MRENIKLEIIGICVAEIAQDPLDFPQPLVRPRPPGWGPLKKFLNLFLTSFWFRVLIIPIWICEALMKRYVWIGMCHQCSAPLWLLGLMDSLPCQNKVSAACLFTGTMPVQAGKEGTLNHPRHDRWTPHTRLPLGAQCPWLPTLGVSMGEHTLYRTGWALRLSSRARLVLTGLTMFTVRWAPNITPKHISTTSDYCGLFPEYEIQTNKGRMLEEGGGLDCQVFFSFGNKYNRLV